jgi:hypothetical protein
VVPSMGRRNGYDISGLTYESDDLSSVKASKNGRCQIPALGEINDISAPANKPMREGVQGAVAVPARWVTVAAMLLMQRYSRSLS